MANLLNIEAIRDSAAMIYFDRLALNRLELEIKKMGNTKWYLPEFKPGFSDFKNLEKRDGVKSAWIKRRRELIDEISGFKNDLAKELCKIIKKENVEKYGKPENLSLNSNKVEAVKEFDVLKSILNAMQKIEKKEETELGNPMPGKRFMKKHFLTKDDYELIRGNNSYCLAKSVLNLELSRTYYRDEYSLELTVYPTSEDIIRKKVMTFYNPWESYGAYFSMRLSSIMPVEFVSAFFASNRILAPGLSLRLEEAVNEIIKSAINCDANPADILTLPHFFELQDVVVKYMSDKNHSFEQLLNDKYGLQTENAANFGDDEKVFLIV